MDNYPVPAENNIVSIQLFDSGNKEYSYVVPNGAWLDIGYFQPEKWKGGCGFNYSNIRNIKPKSSL
jgi:hypothetical protein